MKQKSETLKRIEKNGIILIALFAVIIYWILDSMATEQALTRTMIVVFVIAYGLFTQMLINSRKAALEEKEKTQQQLIQTESLAAIGQLVAGIAHEMNNPLASTSSLLQTNIELLNEKVNKDDIDEEIIKDLEFSLKELRRVESIVKSVLGLSRQTQTYVEDVDLKKIIDDALRILATTYSPSKVTIIKDYENNVPIINGNFANLSQVFINVIKNAIQSLPDDKGTVTLKLRYIKETNSVEFECSDTGIGIPNEVINDIFKPFFTTKEVGQGTGLGLYIAHEIVKKHEGLITITSKQGKGTTCVINLPSKRHS